MLTRPLVAALACCVVSGFTPPRGPASLLVSRRSETGRRAHEDDGGTVASLWQRRDLLGLTAVAGLLPAIGPRPARGADTPPPPSYLVELDVDLGPDAGGDGGKIVIEVIPEWAPLAAERFQKLVDAGFFTDARFFRVMPGMIAQFGIAGDPALNREWILSPATRLPDEPLRQKNKKGTLSFASQGKNTRTTQVFINLADNDGFPNALDLQGFTPFARVVRGMDTTVPRLHAGYGLLEEVSAGAFGTVNQGKAAAYGNEYLRAAFPKLSSIRSAALLDKR